MIFLTLSYFVKNFRIKFESLIVASNCRSRRTKNKLQFSDIIKNLTPSQAKIINRFFVANTTCQSLTMKVKTSCQLSQIS